MALEHTTSMLRGTCIELLHIGGEPTKLFLLLGNNFDASQCLKSGDFSVNMITGLGSPLALISCMVGDQQWMLVKDSVVLRVTPWAFVFSLPGFLYGLTLPSDCSHHRNKLEGIFERYSSYEDLLTKDGSENEEVGTETDLWRLAYSRIERLAGAAGNSIVGGAAENLMIRMYKRAEMTSLLVKLVARNLLSGVLSPFSHVHLVITRGGQESDDHGLYFLPNMGTFADLLDVTVTDTYLASSSPVAAAAAVFLDVDLLHAREIGSLLVIPSPAAAAVPVARDGCWYINEDGIILLFEGIVSLLEQLLGYLRVTRQPRLDVEAEEADDKSAE